MGQITIHGPSGELKQWSIYEELTADLGVQTNHAAEQLLKRTLKKIAPDLLRRIDFDTEGEESWCLRQRRLTFAQSPKS